MNDSWNKIIVFNWPKKNDDIGMVFLDHRLNRLS
jgi:hypothetical protein